MEYRTALTFLMALGLTFSALPAQEEQPKAETVRFKTFDQKAFEEHMKTKGVSDARIQKFRDAVEDETAKHAVDDLLRDVFGDYKAAVALAENVDPKAAIDLTKVLTKSDDKYVQAYTRYHLARFFLEADDPEQAAVVLKEFVINDLNRTTLDAEIIYFYGAALSQIPEKELAVDFFRAFLQEFKDAPERLRASAAQILAELQQQEGVLHDISDIMKNCERRIRKTKTGKDTQDKQQAIIKQLQKIIEELEKQEQSGGGGPGGNNPTSPAKNSALPGGEHKIGDLKKVPKVADKWGKIKDAKRKAIEAELKQKMPAHYRKMLEEFYKKLGTGKK